MSQPATVTLAAALAWAGERLGAGGRLDAELLLAHLLGRGRSHLLAWPEQVLEPALWRRFQDLVRERASGRPTAYLLGEREFWSLPLTVAEGVLVPRPETELLVELALARIPDRAPWRVADLGTGSGAIALAIASERPMARVTAVERNPRALAVAAANASRLGLERVEMVRGDWCGPLAPGAFDLVAANPPYVAEGDPALAALHAEPREALAAGPEGLDDLRRICASAPDCLRPGGWLLLEHGRDQGEAVRALLEAAGLAEVECHRDLAGHPRVCAGRRPLA